MESPCGEGVVFESIWKSFDSKPVLKGLTLKVRPGEIVCLLGPNGSGKSTLFKMSIGVLAPDKGWVKVCGVNPAKDPMRARQIVGYMPEDLVLFESLKVEEFLEFILSIYGVKVDRTRIDETLKLLGLEGELGKFVGDLSRGNKRRVYLAALMLRDPLVLVLDEAFTGLDPVGARILKSWVKGMSSRGATILFSTHVLPIAEAVADRVAIIHEGRIKAEGRPDELRRLFGAEELEEVFLEVTGYSKEYENIIRSLYS